MGLNGRGRRGTDCTYVAGTQNLILILIQIGPKEKKAYLQKIKFKGRKARHSNEDQVGRTVTTFCSYRRVRLRHIRQWRVQIKASQLTENGISQCPAHVHKNKIKDSFD